MIRFSVVFLASWITCSAVGSAENLLLNPSFEHNLDGWQFETVDSTVKVQWHPWSSPDSRSGSVLLSNDQQPPPGHSTITGKLSQCVRSIEPGLFRFTGWMWWNDLAFSSFAGNAEVLYFSEQNCVGEIVASHDFLISEGLRPSSWMYGERIFEAEAAHSALIRVRLDYLWSVDGSLEARFDDLRFEVLQEPEGPGFTDPDFPLFRFKARIIPPGGPAVEVKMTEDCVADAICFSGAVSGRAEVILRLTGVRPNRHIWATIQRLTTSRVEVWISDPLGSTRIYVLDPQDPDDPSLAGITDRFAFFRGE